MTMRAWQLMFAVASLSARLAGEFGPAEFLALGYLALATFQVYHTDSLRLAVRAVPPPARALTAPAVR
jgi:TctA family transporter